MLCELMCVFSPCDCNVPHLCATRESTTDNQREGQEDEVIAMVRASLVDDEANVRSAAAKAFDTLQEHIGARAIDETIPTLLEALRQPGQSSGTALQALREVMAVSYSCLALIVSSHLLISYRSARPLCFLYSSLPSLPSLCQPSMRAH